MEATSTTRREAATITERQLAIEGFTDRMRKAWGRGFVSEARWLEKCVTDLENMSDEEFAERYKDIDE